MPQYSVYICHTIFVSFWIIFHVPACCLYGHCSRRRMPVGVLGSYPKTEFRMLIYNRLYRYLYSLSNKMASYYKGNNSTINTKDGVFCL